MFVYYYHPRTGVFQHVGELGDGDRNPRKPTEFLIPANATIFPPPKVKLGKLAVWNSGSWTIVPDGGVAWRALKWQAVVALGESDSLVCRYYEDGKPVPDDLKVYRAALRAIVGAEDGDPAKGLPQAPKYNEGAP